MSRNAAGIVLYRRSSAGVELLLGHLGGPYFANKHERGWTLPKGLVEAGEDILTAARREWTEETGQPPPPGHYQLLPPLTQRGGKVNHLFLVKGDIDPACMMSNTCSIEWPPRTGRRIDIPEIDRYGWFDLPTSRILLTSGLAPVVDVVVAALEMS